MQNNEEATNPFKAPKTEGAKWKRSEEPKPFNKIVWLLLLPLLFANLIFWPLFVFLAELFNMDHLPLRAMFFAIATTAFLGFVYGFRIGVYFKTEPGFSLPMLYAIGEGLLFPFLVVAPCTAIVIVGGIIGGISI